MAKDKNAAIQDMVSSPEKLMAALVKSVPEREWVIEKITMEGPPHKQLQHTLVLNRLQKLMNIYKKANGAGLKPVKGNKIVLRVPAHETTLPIDIPTQSFEGIEDPATLLEKMSKGPEHEILYTALLLQIIEFMIGVESNKYYNF